MLIIIALTFVLFNAESILQAGQDIAVLLGFGRIPLVTEHTLYCLKSFALLFAAGFLGSTPLVTNWAVKIRATRFGSVLEMLFLSGLLLVCTAYLVDGSFSPFLYFRF